MDRILLYNTQTNTLVFVKKALVLKSIYYLETILPKESHINEILKQKDGLDPVKLDPVKLEIQNFLIKKMKNNTIQEIINGIKTKISKIEDFIPLYDIVSDNIYLIGKTNVYNRVRYLNYRFPEKKLLKIIKDKGKKFQEEIIAKNINEPIVLRKLRKIELMLDYMNNFNINTLYNIYVKVYYEYSEYAGKEITICKRKSFIPQFGHLKPYYTKNEIINLALNGNIIKPNNLNNYSESEQILNLCKTIKLNEISYKTLLDHYNHIIFNKYVGFIQYYTLQGSFFINKYLRGFTNYSCTNDYLENLITPMWKIVLDAPAFEKTHTLYRFIGEDSFLSELEIGDTYTESGFMSTTRDPFYRSDLYEFGFILIKIKIPANIKGVCMCIETI